MAIERRVGGRDNIVVIDRRGRLKRVLTRKGGNDPVWSADGKRIAFERDFRAYTVRARGGGMRRLLPRDVHVEEIDWQPRPLRR